MINLKTEIIKLEELSDSREVMYKKTPALFNIITYVIILLIVVAILISCFWRIDTYVSMAGEVRPQLEPYSINSLNGGKIIKSNYKNGEIVKSGDIIIEFDSTDYEKQKQTLNAQIEKKTYELNCNKALLKSIESDSCLLDKNVNKYFYQQFENYKNEVKNCEESLNNGALYSSKLKIKNTYIATINQIIDKINDEIVTFNLQLIPILNSIDKSRIIAEINGTLNLNKNYSVGEIIPTSVDLGNIISDENVFKIVSYVPEKSISEIFIGQKIEYLFNSDSTSKSIKGCGKITYIAPDSFTDNSSFQVYYKMESDIQVDPSNIENNKLLFLKSGMLVKSHIITGNQTIINYLINKFDLNL